MKSILLSGGTGFIGSHLLKELEKKYKIFLVVRRKKKIQRKNIVLINIKDLKKNRNKKFYAFIHLATYYKNKNNILEFKKYVDSNILLGIEILEIINLKKLEKFIYFSTMMEHLDFKIYKPMNLYAATKKCFHDIISFYKNKYKNVRFYNIKFFETFGLNDNRKKLIPLLLKRYKSKKKFTLISRNLKLNFVSVYDICSGIKILLEKEIPSNTYLMKANKDTKIFDLLRVLKLEDKVNYLNLKQKKFGYNFKIIPYWKAKYSINDFIRKIL